MIQCAFFQFLWRKAINSASICRSGAAEGRNAFRKWDDPNSTNLIFTTQNPEKSFPSSLFSYTELITSVITKTEIVWATRLSSCSRLQLVNWTTIWGHCCKALPRDTASLNWPLKAWQQNIGTKHLPNMLLSSILLLAWQHTSKYIFWRI